MESARNFLNQPLILNENKRFKKRNKGNIVGNSETLPAKFHFQCNMICLNLTIAHTTSVTLKLYSDS